jgi:hypothetical protein
MVLLEPAARVTGDVDVDVDVGVDVDAAAELESPDPPPQALSIMPHATTTAACKRIRTCYSPLLIFLDWSMT